MISAVVWETLMRLPRRDRRHAVKLMRQQPIRLLGGCLICGVPSHGARMGVYAPQRGSPVQQVVVFTFCGGHASAGASMPAKEVERRIAEAAGSRPHVPIVESVRVVGRVNHG